MTTVRRALAIAAATASLVACSPEAQEEAPSVPAEVMGLVTEVETAGDDVTGFTVRAEDGTEYGILIDPELDYGFDLHHLEEHRDEGDPVRVEVDVRDGDPYATAIADT